MKNPRNQAAFVVATAQGPLTVAVSPRYGYFIKLARKARNLFELNKIVDAGLTYKSVQPLVAFLDLSTKELAGMTGVSQRTVMRWDDNTVLDAIPSKNLVMIDALVYRGIGVFGSDAAFKSWLQQPNTALGDQRPVDLLSTPYGIELVEDALGAMEYGQVL